MVGASGAIGGVMGAYVVLYPRVQIHMLIFLFVFVTRIVVPAYFMLGYWFLLQLFSGYMTHGQGGGGTAFSAHGGGFVAGALLIFLFKDNELVAQHRAGAHNWPRGAVPGNGVLGASATAGYFGSGRRRRQGAALARSPLPFQRVGRGAVSGSRRPRPPPGRASRHRG